MNSIKKITAAFLTVAMIVGMVTLNVFADNSEQSKGYILLDYDFETEKVMALNTVLEETDKANIYGKSLKYIPHEPNKIQFSSMTLPVPKTVKEYTVSFDFMLPQTNHNFKMLLRSDATNGDNYTDFGAINWDQNGNIVASTTGAIPWGLKTGYLPDGTSGFKTIAEYKANTWHNMTLRYTPDKGETKVAYYIDGVYCETANMSAKPQTDGYLKNIFIGSAMGGGVNEYGSTETCKDDGTEALYIDNFVITCDNAEYSYGAASLYGNDIRYHCAEGIENSDNLKSAKVLNTETGAEVRIADYDFANRSGVITVSEELDANVEYCIILPSDTKSATQKEIYDNIYFLNAASNLLRPGKLLYESTSEYNYPANKTGYQSINFTLDGDEGQDYMVYVDMTYNAVPDNSTVKFGLCSSPGDYFLMSSKIADSSGRLVIYKKRGGVALDDAVVGESNVDFFHTSNLFTTGSNIRLMYYIDTVNRKGSIYINDELVGTITTPYPNDKSLVPHHMLINSKTEDSSPLTVNSIKVYHPRRELDKVTSFRTFNIDGTQGAPYSSRTLSTVKSAKLYFNCDVDASTLTTDNITISNGENSVDFTVGDYDSDNRCVTLNFTNHLTKGAQYTVSVSNVNNQDGTPIADYETKFNVSNYSDFIITDREFVDSDDRAITAIPTGKIGATIKFVNSTDTDETVRRSIIVTEDGVMTSATEKLITVSANSNNEDSANKVSATVSDASNARVSEICSSESYAPFGQAKVLSNVTAMTEDERAIKYTFENKEYANKSVIIDVMYPDKSYSDMVGTDLTSVLVYRNQLTLDENGKADIEFRMPSTAGSNLYKVLVNGQKTADVSYANILETKDIVEKINRAASAEGDEETRISNIANEIKDKSYALKIGINGYDAADKNYISKLIYGYISKHGALSVDDINSSLAVINKLAAIGCINSGTANSVFDCASELKLDESRIAEFYKKEYATNSVWQTVTADLKGGEYKSEDEFYARLYERFVLAVTQKPDGIDNLKVIFKEFGDEIFGDEKDILNTAKDQAYRATANKKFNSLDELKRAFIAANNTDSSTGGSTAGSGGGGGGRLSDTNVQSGTVKNDAPQEMDINVFSDLDGFDWAKEAIVYLAEKKIINGKGDYRFCPSDNVTRKELAKMIGLAFLNKAEYSDVNFSDVSRDDWAYEYIAKTYAAGIIKGYDDGSFRGDDNISRMDAAVMLYRAAENDGVDFSNEIINHFADEDEFADYSIDAINKLYNQKYISGVGDNKFAPNDNLSRAEAAKIIYSLIN